MGDRLRIDCSSLQVVHSLSARGQTSDVSIVAVDGSRYVFKRYSSEALDSLNESRLIDQILWRQRLQDDVRIKLDSIASWPVMIVESDGSCVGCLVTLAPDRFWNAVDTPPTPRSATVLISSDSGFSEIEKRFHALGWIVTSLVWLHSVDVVVGDLQLANLLVGMQGEPFFIDMDSAVVAGNCCFEERFEPWHMRSPEGGAVHTVSSDWFKCARIVLAVVYQDLSVSYFDEDESVFTEDEQELLAFMLRGRYDDGQGLLAILGQQWAERKVRCQHDLSLRRVKEVRPFDSLLVSGNGSSCGKMSERRVSTDAIASKSSKDDWVDVLLDLFGFAVSIVLFVAFALFGTTLLMGLLSLIPGSIGDWAGEVFVNLKALLARLS